MRTLSAGVILTLFVVSSADASPVAARRVAADAADRGSVAAPPIDRASARELARLVAPPRLRAVAPNLRHDAAVETLARPLALLPATAAGKIVVDGASTLRLRVEATLPGTIVWVAGEDDETFQRFEPGAGATWAPTTYGSIVYVVSERGEAAAVTQLAIGTADVSATSTACLEDVACGALDELPEVADASRAIAMIRFVRGDASYVCTGALVNDAANSGTPYFLTAHHCISTAEEAASIEAVWDERSVSCGSVSADRRRPRTYGATLLASSAETDVALLRLDAIPPNRVFLGVETEPLRDGTTTYRLSHAQGLPQTYATGVVRTDGPGCASAPQPRFIYTSLTSGAVAMGSSGAPILLPGLRIAGQLTGLCGPSPTDSCAIYNMAVDGAIAASWVLLAPYLDPPPPARRRAARH